MVRWVQMVQRTVLTIIGKILRGRCIAIRQRTSDYSLHNNGLVFYCGNRFSVGFSLIEILIVILIIGILSATGLSLFSGVTSDTYIRTRTDELSSFFVACRQRARLRRIPLKIRFVNNILCLGQSTSLKSRASDIPSEFGLQMLDGIEVDTNGIFFHMGKNIEELIIPINMPGNRHAELKIRL